MVSVVGRSGQANAQTSESVTEGKIKVRYIHQKSELAYGNIVWEGKFPMRGGYFPKNHPCCPGNGSSVSDVQFGKSEPIQKFRELGYWASCFPEGDGITMKALNGQSPDDVKQDIVSCFGWEVSGGR